MSEQTWYYIDESQAQYGPITIPDLQALAAAGIITPETQLWTEALGDQWIPGANVEGLFPPKPAPIMTMAPTLRTSPTLRTPTIVASPQEEETYPQPSLAATTPMIPSTPTTQAVRGVPVPANFNLQQPAQRAQPIPAAADPYQSPVTDPQQLSDGMYPATIKKGGSFWLCCTTLILGILLGLPGFIIIQIDDGPTKLNLLTSPVFILAAICLTVSAVLPHIYLHRAWKCLQPGGATMSPDLAVYPLLIPVVNIIWVWVSVFGLIKQWNTITAKYSNTKNAPKLTTGAFGCLIIIPVFGYLYWVYEITKAINFMAALHLQQLRPSYNALAGLGSRAHFK